ncbi:glycine--tRNA ligase subunit beta [Hyphococcus sp.]|uniref:glycine--tRNA ligase subunit beta n=1 Tax=Hyphococcus sp. TaxID=2038636 RepID=UPI003CCBCD62
MSELLLELFSEEIPARMQARAAADLERSVNKALIDAGYMPEGVKAFSGPRRLTVVAAGLPVRQPDRREEKKGPRVGAPDKAVAGFLKAAGLSSLDQCEQREDKKGAYYVAVIDQKGRETAELIAEFVPEIVRGFSWPKSMRWGDTDREGGELRWVRPLHRILCCFDGEVVPFEVGGVKSGDVTEGHRFMAPGGIQARSFEHYERDLRAAKVLIDADERRELIARDAGTLCKAQGLELVEDAGLLNEVAGLAEWPVVMMGAFDEKFLALPDEVLTASMRGHQKYFSVRNPETGRLASKFICVANIEASDGGKAMRAGYERVLTARLSDGWYLYNQDLKTPLAEREGDLYKITFFEGLGTIGDKVSRIGQLASEDAQSLNMDPMDIERAAVLAKCDLVTGMVYEFPELQGVMGRYYALEQGEPKEVADAIRDHYKPESQEEELPDGDLSHLLALCDKVDTLNAFWVIGKKPTGSGDPFALRRAALGVIRLFLTGKYRTNLSDMFDVAQQYLHEQGVKINKSWGASSDSEFWPVIHDLILFFHDRLKVYLRDTSHERGGHKHDHIDAVLTDADGNLQDDLVLIVAKLDALEAFLKTDDGANLVAAYKRAANILKAEEKKDKKLADPNAVDEGALDEPEEKALYKALKDAETKAEKAVADENFEAAMAALSQLRAPLDAFFEKVTVNADDKNLRANRLSLLARLTAATAKIADFSRLEG